MKKILIDEATDDELRNFAVTVQQVETVPSNREGILAALTESGYTFDYILADDGAAEISEQGYEQDRLPEEQVVPMPVKGFGFWMNPPKRAPKCPMVTCKILSTDRPGGNEPAHPSINGSPCLIIQRNVLVSIPYDFYLDLKQAGGTKLVPGADATEELVRMDYQEYPMTDVELPSRAEIAAWQEYTGSIELGRPKAAA